MAESRDDMPQPEAAPEHAPASASGNDPLVLPMAMAQAALSSWMPLMTGQYWRSMFSDVSHPDHGDFAEHQQLEVPETIEDDDERNLFV